MSQVKSNINSLFNSISYRIDNILIDPGDEWEGMDNVDAVLLTHAHFDHIYGLNRVIEKNPNAKVYTNDYGAQMLVNSKKNLSKYHGTPFTFNNTENIVIVNDNDEIEFSDIIKPKAIFTPGHNPSCITWIIKNYMFTGDSYIPGIKIVTNIPQADKELAAESLYKIMRLATIRYIYPGHKIDYDYTLKYSRLEFNLPKKL